MLLAYIDESGINYKKENNYFKDGPFIVYCAMLIPDNKYFHLERLFCELAKKGIGIKNWKSIEAHATDIWARKGIFNYLTQDKVKKYFEELFQLLTKLKIDIIISLNYKNAKSTSLKQQENEKKLCKFSLLHGIEHRLSEQNETAIIIADQSDEISDEIMDNLLYERTYWRYNPGERKKNIKYSKYFFETLSCFILDRVHYMDSKQSLFLQIIDHITFVLRRIFEYVYISNNPETNIKPELNKVPITSDTFCYMGNKIILTVYDNKIKDVTFFNLDKIVEEKTYLNRSTLLNLINRTRYKK